MYHPSTRGRRAIAVTTFAIVVATAACGTRTGDEVEVAPDAPAVVQPAQPRVGSPDAWERRFESQQSQWGEERRGYQYEEESDSDEKNQKKTKIVRNDPRIPDYRY